jgi:hypothetical protein
MEEGAVLLREIIEGVVGDGIFFAEILQNLLGLRFLKGKDLCIDILHVKPVFVAEVFLRDGI